jgi:ferredoxin
MVYGTPADDMEVRAMAMKVIAEECIVCGACEPDCPTGSIMEVDGVYQIDASTCVECEGHYDEPQCIAVCPVECIVPA